MNKTGKGNDIFLILIPFFVIFGLIVADTVLNYVQEKNYKNITEKIIKEVVLSEDIMYEEYYDEIKRRFELEGLEIDKLVVNANDYETYIENEHKYYGLFSSIFGSGEEELVKLFGLLDFKLKKSSRVFVRVKVFTNYDNELELEFVE